MLAPLWNVFLAVCGGVAALRAEASLAMWPLFGLFALIGLGLAYTAATTFTNRTIIRVTDSVVTVRHGPVPFWRDRAAIATARLQRLRVRHRAYTNPEGRSSVWDVLAHTDDSDPAPLVSDLYVREQAAYIAQAIEAHLGIGSPPFPDR